MTQEATKTIRMGDKKLVRLRKPNTPVGNLPPPLWRLPHFDIDLLSNRITYPSHFSHMPHPNDWRYTPLFESRRADFLDQSRYFFQDREAIKTFVDNLGLEDIVAQNGGQKVTIIEGFAGPGTITSELISRKEVGKVIAMETSPRFCWALESLANDETLKDSEGKGPKDKLFVYDRDEGFHWWAYQELEQLGAFSDVKTLAEEPDRPAHRLSPLLFLAQLPNTVHGDQLYTQFIAAMGNGGWLFPYGRVKLAFIMPETLAKRGMAQAGSIERARIGTMAGIYAWQRICQSSEDLQPQTERFWPENLRAQRRALRSNRVISNENMAKGEMQLAMCALTAVPKVRQVQAWRRLSGLQDQVSPDVIEEERRVLAEEGEEMVKRVVAANAQKLQREEKTRPKPRRRHAIEFERLRQEREVMYTEKIAALKARYQELTGETIDEDNYNLVLIRERKKLSDARGKLSRRKKRKVKPQVVADADATVEEKEGGEEGVAAEEGEKGAVVEDGEREALVEEEEEAPRPELVVPPPPGYAELLELHKTYKTYNTWHRRDEKRAQSYENVFAEDEAVQLREQEEREEKLKALSKPAPEIEAPVGVEVDSLDYLLRGVYVLKTKSISAALARTFPGAESVLKRIAPDAEEFYERQRKEQEAMPHALAQGSGGKALTPPPLPPKSLRIHPDTPVCELSDEQWILLARTFEKWPFRPAHLFDESKVASVPMRKPPSEKGNKVVRWKRQVGLPELRAAGVESEE